MKLKKIKLTFPALSSPANSSRNGSVSVSDEEEQRKEISATQNLENPRNNYIYDETDSMTRHTLPNEIVINDPVRNNFSNLIVI